MFDDKDSLLGNTGVIVIAIGFFFLFALLFAGLVYACKKYPKLREPMVKIKNKIFWNVIIKCY
jgi:hypothetical protein